MRRVADGIWQLDPVLPHWINAYLVDSILFDCRTRWSAGSILRHLRGRSVSLVALTHAHPDHWGAAPAICAALGVPAACHHADAAVVRGERRAGPSWHFRLGRMALEAGTIPDVVELHEGDVVEGFRVVHTPGHSSGHVVYFRDRDRVAVVGDLINTRAVGGGRFRAGEPPPHLCIDFEENRRSIARLSDLEPEVVLPGHGPAVAGRERVAELLAAYAA